eukprot:CAMPEP_0206381640 /NCGR_PEP_ID=MMETSP0294-20121207/12775_1 /ASSEMBLY_ACC=CAM_ASM_000327 /TAXON_ID=39354 /ORGANISM="Heterosigma akashiwo, Strain CCMP2393" /LENGTH=559 /DNA_ID=CAMNT_0053831149 /DNA_START=91 /DNA_END=1773 /DNA_ORIENTATION=+
MAPLLVFCCLALSLAAATTSEKPHIVYFLVDDQGYNDAGYNSISGEGQDSYMNIFTPNMDAVAGESIVLTNYYTESLCTPARASLLSGKNPIHNGMGVAALYQNSPYGLPLEHKLLPEHLKSLGYSTHMVGKWHLGYFNRQYLPTARGFDTFLGYFNGEQEYYGKSQTWHKHTFYDFNLNEHPIKDQGILGMYSLDQYDKVAKQIIENHDPSGPLFLYYATQAIHSPFSLPPSKMLSKEQAQYANNIRDLVSDDRGLLAATAAAMDYSFANLMQYLKDAGIYNNTIVIVASDNGGCSNDGGDNYPLRGQKNTLFEGGLRVNAFVHSPLLPEAARGATYDCMVHAVDWLPTLVEGALGVADAGVLGEIDGVSHWDALVAAGEDGGESSCYRTEMMHNIVVATTDAGADTLQAALRLGALKLVYGQAELGWWSNQRFSAEGCSLGDSVFEPYGYVFDIEADPEERHNLIDLVEDETLARLWSRLDEHFGTMAAPAYRVSDPKANPSFIKSDFFVGPWVADEDLVDPRDAYMEAMHNNASLDGIDGHRHQHPDMDSAEGPTV